MVRFTAFYLGLVIFGSSRADAYWQFTRWGMTPAQVIVAGKSTGTIDLLPAEKEGKAQYRGAYTSGRHQFKATYNFDQNRLSSVQLETTNGCGDLSIELNSVYGKAVSTIKIRDLMDQSRWQDFKKGNNIELLDFGDSCTLIYTQLDTASRAGL